MSTKKKSFGARLIDNIQRYWILYVMMIPVIAYYIIFHYVPMYGITLAFKEFQIKEGILGSPWVGFDHFERFFSAYNFGLILKNTVTISVYDFLVGFPLPIIFAVMLNYVRNRYLQKTVQMVSYAPYFISAVVMCGMIKIFCNVDNGLFNIILNAFGFESIDFLSKAGLFKSIYVWSGAWQTIGWNTIIYIAALSGVDPQLHEAAIVDGATKVQRILYVDLPTIKPTIIMLLIMQIGSIMSVGFDKIYLLQNALNLSSSEVISTYVYKVGMLDADYGYSTAIGLFNTIINLILLVTANQISKKVANESLF